MDSILHLLSGSDSPIVWSIFLFGAILGILITWAIWHSKVKGLRGEIDNATALATQFETQAKAAEDEIALKESDLKKSALENIKLRQDIKRTSDEYAVAKSEVQVLKEHTAKVQAEESAYGQQIESLENQLLGLKAKNNTLVDEATKVENSNTNVEVYTLKTKLTKLNSELATALVEVKKLEGLNEDLKKDRDALKLQVEHPKTNVVPAAILATTAAAVVVENAAEAEAPIAVVEKEESATKLEEIPEVIDLESSPITDEDLGDEDHSAELNASSLTESTYSESMMEELGASREDIKTADETVKVIPIVKKPIIIEKASEDGKIENIKVPKLAAKKTLKKTSAKTPSKKKILSSKKLTVKKTVRDDLKKVEGIGPKIEQILNTAGILNWVALAKAKPQDLRDILAEAGNRYKMHNPTTWPEQSALAAKGEWDKLKTFQDFLKGGRDVSA